MRVLVCGAGAMGGFFGSRLLLGGADVDFLVRQRRATQLAGGLVVQAQAGEVRHHVRTVLAGGITAPYDLVLLTCKAYDLECAMDDIACFAVAAAAGYPIAPGLGDTLRRLFANTASSYVPSLRLDMAEGRRTEAEHTIGDYVERATRLGVATPVLAAARCNMQVYEAMRA